MPIPTEPSSDVAYFEEVLASGGVVAIPTETVYGLAALASDRSACARIFELKDRPVGLALPVLISEVDQGLELCSQPEILRAVASFWPGPLTAVLRRATRSSLVLGGDETTIGLRCPDHHLVRHLASRLGPLAVTSANRHGQAPATTAEQVSAMFGSDLPAIFDGGRCDGTPSTVVSLLEGVPVILREGRIAQSDLVRALEVLL